MKIRYLIQTLKLYDEDSVEVIEKNRVKKEKHIARAIRIKYRQTESKVFIRVLKNGNRFVDIAPKLGQNLESLLGMELESTYSDVNYFQYVFLKHRDRRLTLSPKNISRYEKDNDRIFITNNISYELHKVPHSLIVGGTGSGKTFFVLWKIMTYLRLTPQAELRIIDPKRADLSLLQYINGLEDKVATEPNQICKMLRETVGLMEERYSQYFSDVDAFGKTYKDFNLPVVIIIFDEFSAFIHSVDKKMAKEALDYVFVLVMKGRQAGCMVDILMQRPSADDLPTNIRSQMGFKVALGDMDKIGYNMIFDANDMEYKTVVNKGGGYIKIDGVHTNPIYFETPLIPKNFDFIKEISGLIKVHKDGE